jgi:hypothetical protein
MENNNMTDTYCLGVQAFYDSKLVEENPYLENSQESRDWVQGWMDAYNWVNRGDGDEEIFEDYPDYDELDGM